VQVAHEVVDRIAAPSALARGARARFAEQGLSARAHAVQAGIEVANRWIAMKEGRRVGLSVDVAGVFFECVPVRVHRSVLASAGGDELAPRAESLARRRARALGEEAGDIAARPHAEPGA